MPNLTIPAGLASFFRGLGRQAPLDAGNMSNPPGQAPLQSGNYQFINPAMLDGMGREISDIPDVPPAYRDWGQFPMNVGDLSGQTGGGVYSGQDTIPPQEAMLFFDASSGLYYDIGTGFGE